MASVQHIGIIGGVGPEATSILYQQIVAAHKLEKCGQYPKVSIYSLPVSAALENNMIKGLMDQEYVSEVCDCLHGGINMMRRADADMIVLPCNTLTHYGREIFDGPFENPVDAVVDKVCSLGYRRVGILATSATQTLKLYEAAFAPHGISCSYPDEQGQGLVVEYILSNLGSAENNDTSVHSYEPRMLELVQKMASDVDVIVLGCTDFFPLLPLIREAGIPVIDSLDALVDTCIHKLSNTVCINN